MTTITNLLTEVVAALREECPTPDMVLGVLGDLRAEHPEVTHPAELPDEIWWELVDRRRLCWN